MQSKETKEHKGGVSCETIFGSDWLGFVGIALSRRFEDRHGFQLDSITEDQAVLLIKAKLEKEANKYIKEWNDEGIQVENGRWGPFIRFGKKNFKLLNVETGKKMTLEEAQTVTLDFVKDQIRQQGGELDQKGDGSAKKTSRKKPTKAKK